MSTESAVEARLRSLREELAGRKHANDEPVYAYRYWDQGEEYDRCIQFFRNSFPAIKDVQSTFVLSKSSFLSKDIKRAICFTPQSLYYFYAEPKAGVVKWDDIKTVEPNYDLRINGVKVAKGPIAQKVLYELCTHVVGERQTFTDIRTSPIFLMQCIGCNSEKNLKRLIFDVSGDYPEQSVSKFSVGAALMGAPLVSLLVEDYKDRTKTRQLLFFVEIYICKSCYKNLSDGEKQTHGLVISPTEESGEIMTRYFAFLPDSYQFYIWIKNPNYAADFVRINTGPMNLSDKDKKFYREALGSELSEEDLRIAHKWRFWAQTKSECFIKRNKAQKLQKELGLSEPVLASIDYSVFKNLVVTTKHIAWKTGNGITAVEHQKGSRNSLSEILQALHKYDPNYLRILLSFLDG